MLHDGHLRSTSKPIGFEAMIFSFNSDGPKQSSLIPFNTNVAPTSKRKEMISSNDSMIDTQIMREASVRPSHSDTQRHTSHPFVLRNINPYEIWRKYMAGHYDNMVFDTSPISRSTVAVATLPESNDRCKERFYETSGGVTSTIITTGQDDYEEAIKSLDNPQLINMSKTGLCKWCRCDLSEYLSEDAYPVGVAMEMKKKGDIYVFTMIGKTKTCSGSCCLSYAKSKREYRQYVPLIKFLFNLIRPDQKLCDAPDWELHERNNGPLSDEEFTANSIAYIPNGNIVTLPTKSEYVAISQ